jgi:hypothetical protein
LGGDLALGGDRSFCFANNACPIFPLRLTHLSLSGFLISSGAHGFLWEDLRADLRGDLRGDLRADLRGDLRGDE